MTVRIVGLTRPEQYAESEEVQRRAWGLEAGAAVVPAHLLIAAQRHDGLVLGAYDRGKMVGVLYGFTAIAQRRPYHYSHITGVRKERQGQGVGYLLKLAQRAFVMEQGMNLVTWTFDPLQARNAFFNIAKLGGICRAYIRNLYGSLADSLNWGRVTDRFEVEWWLRSNRVKRRIESGPPRYVLDELLDQDVQVVNSTEVVSGTVRRPLRSRLGLRGRRLLVEIPESIVRVSGVSIDLSRMWMRCFRSVFEHYFHRGYVVTDVVVDEDSGARRAFYLLELRPRL